MPWNPSLPEDHVHSPDLANFDDKVGRLLHDGTPVGYVAFRVERCADRVGGFLWWRRFSYTYEIVRFTECLLPGTSDERVDDGIFTAPEALEVDLTRWPVPAWQLKTDPEPSEDWFEQEPALLQVEFLDGDERERFWERYGWADS